METMKSELQRRDKLVAKLEAELRIAYDRAAAQTAQQLQDQRTAHETATQRHLDFAERLLKDKDELAGRCAELSESLAAAEARHASQSAEMKTSYAEQLKKAKKGQQQRRPPPPGDADAAKGGGKSMKKGMKKRKGMKKSHPR